MTGLQKPELVCPAGTPAGLRTAVDAGADAVYCGLKGPTNARNFPGLNFTVAEMAEGVAYAHDKGAKVLAAINSFPTAGRTDIWKAAIDDAVSIGVDAVIAADIGAGAYLARTHPAQRFHLSVQAGASSVEAINYYCRSFGIKRVVLPRILTVAEIAELHSEIECEIEAFIFGNIGMMAEGRCLLTSYVTGQSTNMDGVCSPASHVHYAEDADQNLTTRLGEFAIDCVSCGQTTGYPTICKGRYDTAPKKGYYAFEEPVSLNLTKLLPDLMRAGVTALKIEGRQRSRAYVRAVVSAFRQAVDAYHAGADPDISDLLALTEGGKETQGAFGSKTWR
ncbi:MAG: U32 family peptidase [Alphaproteobacteria bacterium]|nr:U32 family peptidase [Alphaproteobacteria bacterium]